MDWGASGIYASWEWKSLGGIAGLNAPVPARDLPVMGCVYLVLSRQMLSSAFPSGSNLIFPGSTRAKTLLPTPVIAHAPTYNCHCRVNDSESV